MAKNSAMQSPTGLLRSCEGELIGSCKAIGNELGLDWRVQNRATAWLLELLKDDFALAVLDFERLDPDNLAWIQLARRLRPKVPLIVIHEPPIDNATGAEFCEEKVFYFCPRPVDRQLLLQVLSAALRSSYQQERFL